VPSFKQLYLKEIFKEVIKGDIHETNILDDGPTPVIGCGFENLGAEGWFDLPSQNVCKNAITITSDGSPLTAFYHSYRFGAKDNVTVCIPYDEMTLQVIYYVISIINNERWRFSYGRKCYYNKMCEQKFFLPINDKGELDIEYIEQNIHVNFEKITPSKNIISPQRSQPQIRKFILGDCLKTMISGDFHSISELDNGATPLISCGEFGNGLVGSFDISSDYQFKNTITIAYNGTSPLTSRFHSYSFGTKDDVAVLKNDSKLRHSTLIFIAAMLNMQTWRFSYGRKCFKDKLKQQSIYLPTDQNGNIDELYIYNLVSRMPYWRYLSRFVGDEDLAQSSQRSIDDYI
jgi:hypothetical protein